MHLIYSSRLPASNLDARPASPPQSRGGSQQSHASKRPTLSAQGPFHRVWFPHVQPAAVDRLSDLYRFLRDQHLAHLTYQDDCSWKEALHEIIRRNLLSTWAADIRYWRSAPEEYTECLVAILKDVGLVPICEDEICRQWMSWVIILLK